MDWEAEGLLEGLDDGAREARRALLDELHADGVGLEDLRRAVREDRLVLLPIELALMPPPRLTLREVAEAAGLEEERIAATWRAIGVPIPDPEARSFTDEDVEIAKRTRMYMDAGMDDAEMLGLMRVLSSALNRSADAIRVSFARGFVQPGDSELDLARRYSATAQALMPLVVQDLEYLLRLHLREYARHDALSVTGRADGLGDSEEVAVAFADLVGFTALGEQIPESDLGDIAEQLTELTLELVRPPVRLVKTIGDAVMLVSPQPAGMVELLLELVDAAAAEECLPPLRAGASWGSAYRRFGDWYGGTVNLASRVAGRARPGSVLVTGPLHDALAEAPGLAWSRAGSKKLKNVAEPVEAWRVRKSEP
jgi:adenylate cyclase